MMLKNVYAKKLNVPFFNRIDFVHYFLNSERSKEPIDFSFYDDVFFFDKLIASIVSSSVIEKKPKHCKIKTGKIVSTFVSDNFCIFQNVILT